MIMKPEEKGKNLNSDEEEEPKNVGFLVLGNGSRSCYLILVNDIIMLLNHVIIALVKEVSLPS